jgi:alcohol oxidase
MIMANSLLYAASRGHIHITSPTDIYSPPDFDAGYLSNSADISPFVWAYKKTYEIVRRLPSFVEEIAGPAVTLSLDAISQVQEVPKELKDRVYTSEDEIMVEKFVRERIHTTYHPWYFRYCGSWLIVVVHVL